jgi:hypothetical protein
LVSIGGWTEPDQQQSQGKGTELSGPFTGAAQVHPLGRLGPFASSLGAR